MQDRLNPDEGAQRQNERRHDRERDQPHLPYPDDGDHDRRDKRGELAKEGPVLGAQSLLDVERVLVKRGQQRAGGTLDVEKLDVLKHEGLEIPQSPGPGDPGGY